MPTPQRLSVQEVQQLIDTYSKCTLDTEFINIDQSINRICSTEILAIKDSPSFTHAAMDGYAIRVNTTAKQINRFHVLHTVTAGHVYRSSIDQNDCVRIMTGAPIPSQCNCVVMQENVNHIDEQTIEIDEQYLVVGDNIRQQGEYVRANTQLIDAGTRICAQHLALLIEQGISQISVYKQLTVGVISTGDELSTQAQCDGLSQIDDTNRPMLLAMIDRLGFKSMDLGIVHDDEQQLATAIQNASKHTDIIITTGGVSVGKADYTKRVLSAIGEMVFYSIKMRPGKPLAMGKMNTQGRQILIFGLPGNPIASAVSFCFFVRNALLKCAGEKNSPLPVFSAVAAAPFKKRQGRTEFQRARMHYDKQSRLCVTPVGNQGAADLFSLSKADCFVVLESALGNVIVDQTVSIVPFTAFYC